MWFLWLAFLAIGSGATAQETDPLQAPSADELRARIDGLEGSESPDREQLTGSYGQALEELERAGQLEQQAAEFDRLVEETPALAESLREELAQPLARGEPPLPPEATLRDLEKLLRQAEADRELAQKLVDELASETTRRTESLEAMAGELARVRSAITEQETALRAAETEDELGRAQRSLELSELTALRAEELNLKSEQTFFENRREVLPLRRDQAQRQLARTAQLVQVWKERVTSRRQEEAEAAALEVERQRRQTVERFPALEKIVNRNEKLAALRSGDEGLPIQIDLASSALLASKELLEETTRRFRVTIRKVAVAGVTEGMGQLLRQEYEWILSPASAGMDATARSAALSRTQLLQIELQEERENDGDIATHREKILEKLTPLEPDAGGEPLSDLVDVLLTTRRSLQNSLLEEVGQLINALVEDGRVHDELVQAQEAYQAYIEERILWVPSTVGGVLPDATDIAGGLGWLASYPDWSTGIQRASRAARERPWRCSLLASLFLVLLLTRRHTRRALGRTSERVRSARTDRYGHTVRAALDTFLLALPLPLLLGSIGWLLGEPEGQVEVARSVGIALRNIAPTLLVLEFLRQATVSKGLGEAHFRWYGAAANALRTELCWYIPVALSLEFLADVFDHQSTPEWNNALGQIFFIGAMAAFVVLVLRLFRSRSALLAEYYRRSDGLLKRAHKLWSGFALAAPLTLITLALAGYYYTAVQYELYLTASIELAIGLFLLNSLLLRWLFITRRRLAIEQARQRAQARAKAAEVTGDAPAVEADPTPFDEETIDIPAVDAQTRQLIRSGMIAATFIGLFFIWSGAFPALRALDQVQLWPEFLIHDAGGVLAEEVAQEAVALQPPPADTAAATSVTPPPTVVTLANLLLALVIFILTGLAAKDAPAVLEISILQRLPVDSGSRYALSTLFRYAILLLGLTLGFGAIGIGWSDIQWLAAALTFGLAFGLQEIFANFVSGIIILLERPVRVGDRVTVCGTEGRVTKLRMRSTTVLDWDRREILIPNKEFITGNIVNWTLSDPVTRVVVPVGIAYGSDTRLARSLLLRVARDIELVLDDPAPTAIFRGFGESCLDIELRIFMANRNLWPEIIDQLHTQIDDAFREAKIEIAFPQRDLHIRTVEGPRGGEASD